MKTIKKSVLALICVIFALTSCSKSDTPTPNPTVLVLHCIDGQGNPVVGASVVLYNNQTDWQNNTNVAFSGTSDNNGNATFSNVNAQIYYFGCLTTTCLINLGAQVTANAITANTTNTLNVVMTGYGTLTVTSTSSNPYEIKVNGKVWVASLAGGASASTPAPLGNCTVEAIQLSGYAFTPTDNTYSVTIGQCTTTTQDIP